MFEFIEGNIVEITPTYLVLENNKIGYFIQISINTYAILSDEKTAKVYIHQVIREDANMLFGFASKGEREIFRLLITVSGVGANTARMMLSSLSPEEIQTAIRTDDVRTLQGVKGIGAKSAQRIIIDLKDKISKDSVGDEFFTSTNLGNREEALSALVMLGFTRKPAEKVIDKLLKSDISMSVEQLIKKGLNEL